MAKKHKSVKLIGRTFFIYDYDDFVVKEVIFRGESNLVIEFIEEEWKYVVKLERIGNSPYFKGIYSARKIHSNETYQGNTDCTLYENKDGNLLYGKWVEEDQELLWFAELSTE